MSPFIYYASEGGAWLAILPNPPPLPPPPPPNQYLILLHTAYHAVLLRCKLISSYLRNEDESKNYRS